MAITLRQAAAKAAWRTFLLACVITSYLVVSYALQNLRQGKVDPMAKLIGIEVLVIWTLASLTLAGYIVLLEDWRKRRHGSQG